VWPSLKEVQASQAKAIMALGTSEDGKFTLPVSDGLWCRGDIVFWIRSDAVELHVLSYVVAQILRSSGGSRKEMYNLPGATSKMAMAKFEPGDFVLLWTCGT
jgi:hypothetical protein